MALNKPGDVLFTLSRKFLAKPLKAWIIEMDTGIVSKFVTSRNYRYGITLKQIANMAGVHKSTVIR